MGPSSRCGVIRASTLPVCGLPWTACSMVTPEGPATFVCAASGDAPARLAATAWPKKSRRSMLSRFFENLFDAARDDQFLAWLKHPHADDDGALIRRQAGSGLFSCLRIQFDAGSSLAQLRHHV